MYCKEFSRVTRLFVVVVFEAVLVFQSVRQACRGQPRKRVVGGEWLLQFRINISHLQSHHSLRLPHLAPLVHPHPCPVAMNRKPGQRKVFSTQASEYWAMVAAPFIRGRPRGNGSGLWVPHCYLARAITGLRCWLACGVCLGGRGGMLGDPAK